MIKRLIMYFGKRSHNIQVQLLCATFYGLVSIYGVFGSVAFFLKARKMAKRRAIVIMPLHWKLFAVTAICAALFGFSTLNHAMTYRHLCYEWAVEYACLSAFIIYKAVKA